MKTIALSFAVATLAASAAFADPVKIVAAENFYGDLAKQIGGANVEVTSILSNPDQDPHLFEASPETAKAIAVAKIAIANGADYDPWMQKLLVGLQAARPQSDRGWRSHRRQAGRQSASLVRAGDNRESGGYACSDASVDRPRPRRSVQEKRRGFPRLDAAG